ncbi:DUF6484 domain-containing protein [Cystobacter ferrugineus]|uniref:DUF6484 domain-containing protein n=1 Tax=Cystobacter ferrugineus TaxID=83449 RepID=A0A1L9BAD8_9BACT|nr:DUF6484 domain-containing protein [Cystobacter ferrugineus]OJH39236.1 hypothetical protein BON30_17050 [Cystobacter ferrugineus]
MSSPRALSYMPSPPCSEPKRISGPRTGWVAALDADGMPLVDFEDNPAGRPLPAQCGALVEDTALVDAARNRQGALLLFEEEDATRPVLVTLLRSRPRQPGVQSPQGTASTHPREVRVDGQRVVLEARDELELRCGDASIILRRNGRIVLEGLQVDSRSRGLQRIRGGKVEIN